MLSNFNHAVRCYIGHRTRTSWVKTLGKIGYFLYTSSKNLNFDADENGEVRIVHLLKQFQPKTIVDIGANVGHYAELLHNTLPDATIHCFEPVPTTYKHLLERVGNMPRVKTYNYGLSVEDSQETIYASEKQHWLSSVHPIFTPDEVKAYDIKEYSVEFKQGERAFDALGLETIDFLKMDVEGHELSVLQGVEKLLAGHKIRCGQFEYGYINIQTKTFLSDFYTLLEKYDYSVGKIFPDHVEFGGFSPDKEDFLGPNIFFVHNDEKDLKEKIANQSFRVPTKRSFWAIARKRRH